MRDSISFTWGVVLFKDTEKKWFNLGSLWWIFNLPGGLLVFFLVLVALSFSVLAAGSDKVGARYFLPEVLPMLSDRDKFTSFCFLFGTASNSYKEHLHIKLLSYVDAGMLWYVIVSIKTLKWKIYHYILWKNWYYETTEVLTIWFVDCITFCSLGLSWSGVAPTLTSSTGSGCIEIASLVALRPSIKLFCCFYKK